MFVVSMPKLSIFTHTRDTQMLFAMEQKQFRIKDNVFSFETKKTEENFNN